MSLINVFLIHVLFLHSASNTNLSMSYVYDVTGRPMPSYMTDPNSHGYQKEVEVLTDVMKDVLKKYSFVSSVEFKRFEPNCNQSFRAIFWISIKKRNLTKTDKQTLGRALGYKPGHIPIFSDGESQCKSVSVKLKDGTVIKWPRSHPIDPASKEPVQVLCTAKFDPCRFAKRYCYSSGHVPGRWGRSDTSQCEIPINNTTKTTTPQSIGTTHLHYDNGTDFLPDNNTVITPDNANSMALQLEAFLVKKLQRKEVLSVDEATTVVNLIGLQLTKKKMINSVANPMKFLDMLSIFVSQFSDVSQDQGFKGNLAVRTLKALENIANFLPLKEEHYTYSSESLAFALLSVNSSDTRHFVIGTVYTDRLSFDQVVITVQENGSVPDGFTNYVSIPMKAVIDSMKPADKHNLSRLSMFCFENDDLYRTIGEEDSVSSQIIKVGLTGVKVENLNEKISLGFHHMRQVIFTTSCVFWKPNYQDSFGVWSYDGCELISTNDSFTVCACNHLTDFALIEEDYYGRSALLESKQQVLSLLSAVGCITSSVFLVLTLTLYCLLRDVRADTPSKILINICVAFLLSKMTFIFGMNEYTFDHLWTCRIVAMLLHYFLLASITWVWLEAFNVYISITGDLGNQYNHLLYKMSLVAWGVPFIIVLITALSSSMDNYGLINSTLCWIKSPAFQVSFVAPVVLILLLNCFVFGRVICVIRQTCFARRRSVEVKDFGFQLKGVVGILTFLTLTWSFALLAIDSKRDIFRYFFAFCNSLQGVFIFIFYCIVRREFWSIWRNLVHSPIMKSACSSDITKDGVKFAEEKYEDAGNTNRTEVVKFERQKDEDAGNSIQTATGTEDKVCQRQVVKFTQEKNEDDDSIKQTDDDRTVPPDTNEDLGTPVDPQIDGSIRTLSTQEPT